MITRDFQLADLDARWTPNVEFGSFGLHADSTIWRLARGCHQTSEIAGGDEARRSSYKDNALESRPSIFLATKSRDLYSPDCGILPI
jgi:hypothetical protein